MTLRIDRQHEWTYEETRTLPEDGRRYEVIDGVLYVSPSPSSLHQILSRRLQFFFYPFELEGEGYIFDAPMDLVMPGCTPVQPDLIFLLREQRSLIKRDCIEGIPHLVVEILSPSSRSLDRVKKLTRYAQNGVPYYLILDPEASTFEVLRHTKQGYNIEACMGAEEVWDFRGRRLELGGLFSPLPE